MQRHPAKKNNRPTSRDWQPATTPLVKAELDFAGATTHRSAKMKLLLIIGASLLLGGCDEPLRKANSQSGEAVPHAEKLAFAPLVDAAIHKMGATVIFDSILRPGEEQAVPSVVGAGSIGYYVDDQFDLDEAGGFVRIYGSDGSEGGGAIGGTFRRQDGAIQASYRVKNTGRLPRRLLVYTTTAEAGTSNGG